MSFHYNFLLPPQLNDHSSISIFFSSYSTTPITILTLFTLNSIRQSLYFTFLSSFFQRSYHLLLSPFMGLTRWKIFLSFKTTPKQALLHDLSHLRRGIHKDLLLNKHFTTIHHLIFHSEWLSLLNTISSRLKEHCLLFSITF